MATKATGTTPLCIAPFTALQIGAEGDVAPCCEFVGKIGSTKESRTLNKRFPSRLEKAALLATPPPEYLDIRFSNLCNFRCRTCHHGASSRWFADAKALGQKAGATALLSAFKDNESAQSQFEPIAANLTDLYFAGGEPLLEKQHLTLLRYLIAQNRTDIRLSYNTNLSTLDFEGSDIVRLWQSFPRLNIEASIDAIGPAGALIRKGFDWQVFRENLTRLQKECPHMVLHIGVTVSVFNLLRLTSLHQTLTRDCGVAPEAFNFHTVQMPRYYGVGILPKDIKERAMVQLEAYAAELYAENPASDVARQLQGIARQLTPDSSNYSDAERQASRVKFRDITAKLDSLRGEKTTDTLPELSGILQS